MIHKLMIASFLAATSLIATTASAQQWGGRSEAQQSGERSSGWRGGWNRAERIASPQPQPQTQQPIPAPAAPQRNWNNGGNWGNRDGGQRTTPSPRPAPGIAVGEPNPSAPARSDRGRWQGRGGWDSNRATPDVAQRPDRTGRNGGNDWRSRQRETDSNRGNWNHNNGNGWNQNGWRSDDRRQYDRRAYSHRDNPSWNRNWRNDNRYDWRGYRNHDGDRYRLGRYYAPHGWNYGYRRLSIGFYLDTLFFSNDYWIDDPWSYRLPAAYGPLRWVRYYDDALLVDVRNGYVVDVVNNFFW
jgi:Nickel/cobalt transporter regulator